MEPPQTSGYLQSRKIECIFQIITSKICQHLPVGLCSVGRGALPGLCTPHFHIMQLKRRVGGERK